jgi:hypothetical protein
VSGRRRGFPIQLVFWLYTATLNLSGHQTFAASQPAAAKPVPMARAAFADLLLQLQRKSFGDEKLQVARAAAASGQRFSCEQVGQLMRTTALGDEQVQIAATLYPRLTDPENLGQLLALLRGPAERDKLRRLVGPLPARTPG